MTRPTTPLRCPECHRIAPRDDWPTHPRQGHAICPTCWHHGVESMPEAEFTTDDEVIQALRKARIDGARAITSGADSGGSARLPRPS